VTGAREGLARSVQVRLARHARAIGVDPNLVLTRYAVERFLYRLSRSAHADRFVLKGALLLLVWLGETLRPTRDADLLGFGELSDEALGAMSRLTVQLDIGIGDAVTPGPQWLEYPSLLEDLPRPRLRTYPRETVLAEKLHAMVFLGLRTSRMKDYFDVYALLREDAMDPTQLARAIAATFARRRTALPEGVSPALSNDFFDDPTKQAQWRAFLARNRIDGPTLQEVVVEIRTRLAVSIAEARVVGHPEIE
jgi:hypothetical protein